MFTRLVVDAVTWTLSVYGTIETPYLDSSSSGTDQETVTSAAAGSHQASIRPLMAAPGRVRMYQPHGITAAMVEAALRPLHSAMATAERATAPARLAAWPRPVAVPPFA